MMILLKYRDGSFKHFMVEGNPSKDAIEVRHGGKRFRRVYSNGILPAFEEV